MYGAYDSRFYAGPSDTGSTVYSQFQRDDGQHDARSAFAIPGVDEATSFAEIIKSAFLALPGFRMSSPNRRNS